MKRLKHEAKRNQFEVIAEQIIEVEGGLPGRAGPHGPSGNYAAILEAPLPLQKWTRARG